MLLIPAILFSLVVGTVFVLAELHPAREEASSPPPGQPIGEEIGRGQTLFAENCSSCHGHEGAGGGIGPTLAGSGIARDEARATIENGRGVMPANLVEGQELEDVLAYLETIVRQG